MEHNANHISLLYCHLPVSCRSLVDQCDSLGRCKHSELIYLISSKICLFLKLSVVLTTFFSSTPTLILSCYISQVSIPSMNTEKSLLRTCDIWFYVKSHVRVCDIAIVNSKQIQIVKWMKLQECRSCMLLLNALLSPAGNIFKSFSSRSC